MEQPIQVVMLPTEDETDILYYKEEKHCMYGASKLSSKYIYQHLYITVSQDIEEIKDGVWCYHIPSKEVVKYPKGGFPKEHCRKIIATTDPKLRVRMIGCTIETKPIPQVQQSFLKEYVANPDGDWEVEYEDDSFIHVSSMAFGSKVEGGLKLNQNNTVNITSVEEKIYSREEIIDLFSKCNKELRLLHNMEIKEWIKENL